MSYYLCHVYPGLTSSMMGIPCQKTNHQQYDTGYEHLWECPLQRKKDTSIPTSEKKGAISCIPSMGFCHVP